MNKDLTNLEILRETPWQEYFWSYNCTHHCSVSSPWLLLLLWPWDDIKRNHYWQEKTCEVNCSRKITYVNTTQQYLSRLLTPSWTVSLSACICAEADSLMMLLPGPVSGQVWPQLSLAMVASRQPRSTARTSTTQHPYNLSIKPHIITVKTINN